MRDGRILKTSRIDFPGMFDLGGKVALVTGASGMIGSLLSEALAACGADVVLVARNAQKLKEVSEKVLALGRKSLEVVVDVTKEEEVKRLTSKAVKKFKQIDILVAAAGSNILKPAIDFPLSDWEKLMQANATSTFLCNKEVGRVMIAQKRGKIVNLSSIRGRYATSGNTLAYSATKSAINMITRVLACEWAQYNINVNAIAPAMVATGMHMAGPDGETLKLDPKVLEGIVKRTPMKRLARPEDLCGAVIFLASRASDFMSGQILYVDGGASVWAA
ncbi:MAG: SDR family oxidoreductase [Thaumarchaeota archaeon]|nr:SDR family oxidoreductase [Nitrososphaerota archaeon]